ncbi:sigma-70 family RNA polymerase sigma factor [Alicyclobacillus acidocaldarius]|uniref:RNA polymerase sigma-70 region 4 domain-containing protein n=1 Tax=Alicyclobacillus acidocaldarius (strain Tc-4-1) TaxID=1048834 RepID=F8IH14_ALIAT|nr:sigma-70 family RNA polymerase sigma factor [Alicyclobacillus acidocaldarius]AEJ44368.1 hypothetical protein TC41_2469 [Alicyclobacillus acidocaldarius subsp. acidocaldarius Tc-4-1]
MTAYTPEQEIAWIRKIIHNAVIDEYRRWKRWNRELLILNAPRDYEEDDELIETIAAQKTSEDNIELHWLVEQLPARERAVIRALYFEGLSQREVANRMNLSQKMVSKLHRSALRNLKESIST